VKEHPLKGKALKKRFMTCTRCKGKVFDTVITKHMWEAHAAHMMKSRGGRKKNELQDAPVVMKGPVTLKSSPSPIYARPVDLGLHAARQTQSRANYIARPSGKLTIVVWQGANAIEISKVTKVEIFE
jgi:hypothetical protein